MKKMEKLLKEIYEAVDVRWSADHGRRLNTLEQGQTFRDYDNAAHYTFELLQKEGFEAELLTFPADGKTTYLDMRTPMAWDATVGRLTVVSSPVPFEDPVVADFSQMPLSLVKHSVSTPAEGLRVRLIPERQVYAGADCTGCLVLLEAETAPRANAITPLLDRGALGFVSDYLRGGEDTPDCVQWVNAGTDDTSHWHVQCEDRDFIGYSVSPRKGKLLRKAALLGEVEVLAESDGRRYEGHIHAVTARIPGKRQQEVWLLAHLFEPFIADNAVSVTMAIGAARQIRDMLRGQLPEFGLRLVFAMESYGYAAVAHHMGGALHKIAVGGLNVDTPPVEPVDTDFLSILPPYASPYYGSVVYELAAEAYTRVFPGKEGFPAWMVSYSDDCLLGDTTVGVPTIYLQHNGDPYWHNSIQDNDYLEEDKLHRVQSLVTLWAWYMMHLEETQLPELLEEAVRCARRRLDAAVESSFGQYLPKARLEFFLEGERRKIRDFARVADIPAVEEAAQKLQIPCLPQDSQETISWLRRAEKMIVTRETVGFPYDMIRIPKKERRPLPNNVIYGPMGVILAAMDGKEPLDRLIRGALWEQGTEITEETVRPYVEAVEHLAKAGYLRIAE